MSIYAPIGAHYTYSRRYSTPLTRQHYLNLTTATPKPNNNLCGLICSIDASNTSLHNTQNEQHKLLDGQHGQGTSEVPPSEAAGSYLLSVVELQRSSPPEILNPQTVFHLQTQQFISGRKRQSGHENQKRSVLTLLFYKNSFTHVNCRGLRLKF